MSTCVTDLVTLEVWCSTGKVLVRTKGGQKFENVTKQLLYVSADVDADGVIETFPLFSDTAYEYFWQYDNHGLKLAQLRFYEIPTDINQ